MTGTWLSHLKYSIYLQQKPSDCAHFSYTKGCAFRASPDSFFFSCHEIAPTTKKTRWRNSNYHDLQASRNSNFIFKHLALGDYSDWFLQMSHPKSKKDACVAGFNHSFKNLLTAGIRWVPSAPPPPPPPPPLAPPPPAPPPPS